ncbi:unnamed protein product [Rotaria sordida]|uniref:MULE transposase domain-containing protein n=1 Tax=Rotaria sordida TaxID=392033 RepID=A0A819EIH9_9BILA|nr:unnamed protein product [Rotaria sordida]CAF4001826.1 unnamed protein product [Rotaria sordida]
MRCTKISCPASITTSNNDIILRTNEIHNHLIETNDIKILELRHKLKKEVETTSAPIDKIVESAYSVMITEERKTDSVSKFPTIKTLKNTASKQRRKIRPPLPKHIEDIPFPLPKHIEDIPFPLPKHIEDIPFPLPTLYTLTKHNTNFLLFDGQLGETRGLIFASQDDIRYLANQKFWYADGTFYTSPSVFYQIYSIHAYDEGLSTPCVFALLADKKEETYQDFFLVLKKKIIETSNMIRLESITIDFEAAVKNVFYKNFPCVQVKGCLFHYGQALFRKFVDVNLRAAFKNDENVRIWFRSFAAVALLPPEDMNQAIEDLESTITSSYQQQINMFLEYHRKRRHNKWKKRSTRPHPDIYAFIDLFKNEQLLAQDQRQRHEAGAAPPKRKKTIRIAEESLYRLWDKLEKTQIDTKTFLKGAGLRYFQYLKIE